MFDVYKWSERTVKIILAVCLVIYIVCLVLYACNVNGV